jgi:hypothetical protein
MQNGLVKESGGKSTQSKQWPKSVKNGFFASVSIVDCQQSKITDIFLFFVVVLTGINISNRVFHVVVVPLWNR